MKFEIINNELAKEITGWNTDIDHKFKGIIDGYVCGYNFEVIKNGITDFTSAVFTHFTPDYFYNNNINYYADILSDMGCVPTGRVIFRGYYISKYDPYERDEYYVNANI